MTERLEEYNNVFTSDQLSFTFSDPEPDGDKIDVKLNGSVVAEDLELTESGSTVDLPALTTGANQLQVVSKNAGTVSTTNQVKIDVPTDSNLYGKPSYTFTLEQGQSNGIEIGLPKIRIDSIKESGNQAPFVAQNILDTLDEPIKLTLDRGTDARKRRDKKVKAYTNEFGLVPAGFDRDEVPPAVGIGDDALSQNVRAIPEKDNGRGGNVQKELINNYGSEDKQIPNGSVIDFYALPPDYEEGVTGIIPTYGTDADDSLAGSDGNDDLIYGLDGADTISGDNPDTPIERSGNDTLLGGRGNDIIRGRGGNDIVVGQPDDDLLFGDLGNDVVYGSPGNDVLYGDNNNVLSEPLGVTGEDIFVFKKKEGIDLIRDFELGNDKFAYSGGLFNNLKFEQITDGKRASDGTDFISQLPQYPLGSDGSINPNGTEIWVFGSNRSRETLGYFEDVSANELDNKNLFDEGATKTSLPDPIV